MISWEGKLQDDMAQQSAFELQRSRGDFSSFCSQTGARQLLFLGTKLQCICSYCKTAHDKQFCPGCGASKER